MEEKGEKTIIIVVMSTFLLMTIIGISFLTQTITGNIIYNEQPDPTIGIDTYLRQESTSNYGLDTKLKVGNVTTLGGRDLRPLIKFNILSIPTINTIINATIELYITNPINQNNITINTYRVTRDWNESEANWINATSSIQWISTGGDYTGPISSTTVNQTGWYSFDITDAVRDWVDGSEQNYGIMLYAPSTPVGDSKEFASSDHTTANLRPKITINHVDNAPPTINVISTNSSPSSPKLIGQSLTFTVNWSDIESHNSQIYVCNSSSITVGGGCADTTFCSTSLSSTNPATCAYTVLESDNKTTSFWVAACDTGNCSSVSLENFFYINHIPKISLTQPNGGETVNQSQGNYSIIFSINDSDSDTLEASIYYGATQGSTTNIIQENINLSFCDDGDSDTATTNECTYSWNSSGIYGTYFLTIILNDSISTTTTSSSTTFDIRSIIDDQAPQITYLPIDSDIYSGETIQVDATITDDNIITAWLSFNYTGSTVPMTNTTSTNFRGFFQAPVVGTRSYRVNARDLPDNLNDSTPWQTFTVRKPNAATSNEQSPSTALPFHTIRITGDLNTTDALTNISAYLNVPNGFTFLEDYQQNNIIGNIATDATKTAEWFISTPIAESTYTLNITYTDAYGNSWQSNNFQTQVTSAIGGGYSVGVTGSPEVGATETYYVESTIKQSGQPTNPDSIEIIIYDAAKNLIPTNPMTQKSTGVYNYSYTLGAAPIAGLWETIINATIGGTSYYTNEFWKVVGALFDVRDITIINSSTTSMNISVILENIGNNPTDLFLQWNLTREDNDAILDSGFDTIGVGATPITHHISPSTSYIGQTRITFIGTYLNTEKAAAYKIFSTTDGEKPADPAVTPGGGNTGGGESGTETTQITTTNETKENITKEDPITKDLLLRELTRLKEKRKNTNESLIQQNFLNLSKELDNCQEFIDNLESNIEKEEFINALDNIDNADDCIKKIEDRSKLTEQPFTDIKMAGYWVWIITWTLIIILIGVLGAIVYFLYKKLSLMNFIKERQSLARPTHQRNSVAIDEKLRSIKERLG